MLSALSSAIHQLNAELANLSFSSPVSHVYNPLEYAWDAHAEYLRRYATSKKRVLFLGMNPGPFGMTQTGIPFGEIPAVRDWLGIQCPIAKPAHEHPKRPITGFGCTRSEVSGRRLWGLFADRFPDADSFFEDHFVANFCPLVWMSASGSNITPDKLPKNEYAPVDAACRIHLARLIELLEPEFLIGMGAFAENQLTHTVREYLPDRSFTIGKILHPSPASPAANRGWAEAATQQLLALRVW